MSVVQERGDKQAKNNTDVEQALMRELRELKGRSGCCKRESSGYTASSKPPHTTADGTTSTGQDLPTKWKRMAL